MIAGNCILAESRRITPVKRPRNDTFLEKCIKYQAFVNEYLSTLKVQNPYLRVLDPTAETTILRNGKTMIMLGSNNYLGLATHPEVKKAAKRAIDIYGTGCCSSRPLAGTTSLHVELEEELARFKGTEASLLFSTGYMTMMGTIYALAGEGDVIFSDQLNHASIIDGARLSKAQVQVYRHNDMESLEEKLAACNPEVNKLIVTDGVFSMKGDLANLPEIKRLAKLYNAWIMVDDAHGTGVMGETGRGVAEHFHLEGEVDLICCTFSKVLGTVGGAVGAKKEVIDFLRLNSRPFVFTASLPPSVIMTVLASLRVIRQSPHLLQQLRRNADFLRENLINLNFRVEETQTPIIPILVGNDEKVFRMAWGLEEEGIFINPIVPPAVSAESSLIRVTTMATHTLEELEFAVDKFRIVGKRVGLI